MKNILIAALILIGSSAMAHTTVGSAGCGLGSMAFGSKPGMIQIVAGTLNGLGANQIFGISSGTSNCAQPEGLAKLEVYIDSNRVALANDMARGQGETLAGISQIMNCQSIDKVGGVLKAHYSEVFSSSEVSSDQVSTNVQNVLKSNNVQCSAI